MKQGWEIKKLGEVCEFSQGIQVPIEEQYNKCEEGMIRFLRIIDFTQNGEIPRYVYNVGEKYILHDNETAIVRYGTPGFVCYGKYGIIANNLFKILPKQNIFHTPFLRYWLKSNAFQGVIKGAKYGVALQAIKFSTISNIPISIPPRAEQERIVEELDCLSGVIEKKREQLRELDALAQSIFYQMFGDPITNEKGWEVKKLGEVCDIYRGGSPRPIEQYLGGNIPWIKIGDAVFGTDIYLTKTKEHIIEEGLKKTRFIHSGSLIFANCGVSLGFARIITFDGCIHDGWLAFDNISNDINKIFLLKSLNFCTQYFRETAPDGTQPNLNTGIMKAFAQIIPPLALQQEFADKIEAIEKQKALIKQSITETETLFNARMDYYFD